MADLEPKHDQTDECGGACPLCVQARRMVSAVVAGSMNEILASLGEGDLDSARRRAAALLSVLEEVPPSIAALVGDSSFAGLKSAVEKGLWETTIGDMNAAWTAFQTVLLDWCATYPPYHV